jgi:hypothetical protein
MQVPFESIPTFASRWLVSFHYGLSGPFQCEEVEVLAVEPHEQGAPGGRTRTPIPGQTA